jgi:hypothetical protein
MQPFDWILVGASLLAVFVIGWYTQRYVRSVADFLSAGRVARRYLLAVSKAEMASGAVVFVATFEVRPAVRLLHPYGPDSAGAKSSASTRILPGVTSGSPGDSSPGTCSFA